jgi:regulation of enolase protein 1 (concanavalin A-like superfamily)
VCNGVTMRIEFADGTMHLRTVMTRDFSDWSMIPLTNFDGGHKIRLTRLSGPFAEHPDRHHVLFAKREGSVATFTILIVTEPISTGLHGCGRIFSMVSMQFRCIPFLKMFGSLPVLSRNLAA